MHKFAQFAKDNRFLIGIFVPYAVITKILFDQVYITSNVIVDEEFHLPLGEQYCKYNFKEWDPKVTTLPGLYLASTLLLGPLHLCSIYYLRLTSLLFSCLNLLLLYYIYSKKLKGIWQVTFSAIMLALLPPLYFLAHVYYTEVVSLTAILLLMIFHQEKLHYFASFAGFFAVLCRQTNVVFVAIYGGSYVLQELHSAWAVTRDPLRRQGELPIRNLKPFLKDLVRTPAKILNRTKISFWLNSLCYASVLMFFVVFLIFNGGIVVGDRSAHTMSINIPQIFYFSLFCTIFAWPYFLLQVLPFCRFAKRRKLFVVICSLIAGLIVHFNTVVHPYLLADNRHLMFYIWMRFYAKYFWFKYAIIPVYIFAIYVIMKLMWDNRNMGFFILFIAGISLLLVSQTLVDIRYFLVPYIIIRLKMRTAASTTFTVILEFLTYCVMNMITFNIFFTKTVYWDDLEDVQRIIW